MVRLIVKTPRAIDAHKAGARFLPHGHRWAVATLICLPLAFVPVASQALNLAQSPLFLQNAVQPNIFLMLDDSGSMDWTTVYNPGTNCNSANGTSTLDLTPDTSGTLAGCPSTYTILQVERLRLCVGFNTLAYSPSVTYTPWYGKDDAGVVYKNAWLYGSGTDASPNFTVRQNPYLAGGATTNLAVDGTVAYRLWTDSNADGDYADGECGDKDSATSQTWYFQCPTGGCPAGTGVLTVAEQKNFANWYMYYRKREYVMKRAISEIIQGSQARMGLSTLWRNALSGSVGRKVENIDDISVPVNSTAAASKADLLDHLGRIDSINGTPLRTSLFNVGRYFEGGSTAAFSALFGTATTHSTSETIDARSPILNAANGGACQQNFTVMMTDGFYNSGFSSAGSTAIGNDDGNTSSAFDVAVPPATTNPYTDGQSETLGDIAMYFYERDLRSDLLNKVPYTENIERLTQGTLTPGDASADDKDGTLMHQHVVTYTVAFGLAGNLDPPILGQQQKTASACDTNPADPCWAGWPNLSPASMENTPDAVDDLWHAAYNGRGKFLSGRNPTLLAQALKDAIADISARSSGTTSSVSISSTGVSTGTRVFVPRYTSKPWYGDLVAYGFDANNKLVDVSDWGGSPSEAGPLLQQNWSTRAILTHNGTTGTGGGRAFVWGSLTAAQQAELNKDPSTNAPDVPTPLGQDRLAYLRGDPSKEGTLFRVRTYDVPNPSPPPATITRQFVLGDIVNSSPIYVGAPSSFYSGSAYASFRSTYFSRTPMVYVGANDGVLHGFDANTGREKIGYVPNKLFPKLNRLTDKQYLHTFYVDGTPTVADAAIGAGPNPWRTVLVGGLRAGGQGIYALDVTDPAQFSESNTATVLWEFTDASDATDGPDLGYTFSQPVIAQSHDASNRWVAIFGNGYNNSEAADGIASTTGVAALFIVNLATGSLVKKIPLTGYGTALLPNGLASVKVIDSDGDAIADFAYAGDLLGNLWKFDLTGNTPGSWVAYRLFTAKDPTNNVQPITSKPEVIRHPTGTGFLVMFGTGKYLESGGTDTGNTQVQSFYGVWDIVGAGTGVTVVPNNEILAQTVTTTTDASGDPVRTFLSPQQISWNTALSTPHKGWKVDLPASGERHVATPQFLSDNRILFVTSIPSTDPCSAGGESWLWQLNVNGGGPPVASVFDTNDDGVLNDTDKAGGNVVVGVSLGSGVAPAPTVVDAKNGRLILVPKSGSKTGGDCDKGIDCADTDVDPDTKRQSWRQIY